MAVCIALILKIYCTFLLCVLYVKLILYVDICTGLKWITDSIRFNHKNRINTEVWIGEWWSGKYALMPNAVITEPHIVIQSIARLNNVSAMLVSNLWFTLIRLSIYRKTPAQAMNQFHFPAHFDQAAYYSDAGSAGTSFAGITCLSHE